MFIQQQQGVGSPLGGRNMGAVGGFNQGGPNVLQGPLAYLEKTTSNIGLYFFCDFALISLSLKLIYSSFINYFSFINEDLVGMGDGRR